MGKGSLLGDPPGSAGSLRQQAMGEKLTDQVKGNGCPAKIDGCINDGGRRMRALAAVQTQLLKRRKVIHPERAKDAFQSTTEMNGWSGGTRR